MYLNFFTKEIIEANITACQYSVTLIFIKHNHFHKRITPPQNQELQLLLGLELELELGLELEQDQQITC
jgi:hypothetical protein